MNRLLVFAGFLATSLASLAQSMPNPILFVTQMPIPGDFATIASVFGNHRAETAVVGRGGDLYIRYADGSLRNLTAEAGYGAGSGFQGANSIAVRDPAVHWSGTRAVFAMVVGAPTQRFQVVTQRWQLFEVTGLEQGQTAVITKVPNQPSQYNNVEPTYASDGDLIFSSDRPRNGATHLYPQLDEYESRAITTGLWRLDATSGDLTLLQHSPSGSFTPMVDSFGRVVFTRWDHLQRDQQNDGAGAATFNYSSEDAASVPTTDRSEVFPAPRSPPAGSNFYGHTFNQMFPWQVNQDGTEEEFLNHMGRHELSRYFRQSLNDDPNLVEFSPSGRTNPNEIAFVVQMREYPNQPGRFVAVDTREFEQHAAGQLISFSAPPNLNPAQVTFEYLTSRKTYCPSCDPTHPDNTGHYRNPLPLSSGGLVAAHTSFKGIATNLGTRASPRTPFEFRLKRLGSIGQFVAPVETLTGGIVKRVSYYDPDELVSYDGPFWELSPVEVRSRAIPPETGFALRSPEQQAFELEGVDADDFRGFLRANELGVVVMRNVTTRDFADKQQPYNLRVPGGTQTIGSPGRIYDVSHLQFFQGDQIRGGGGSVGRRVLAQTLHAPAAVAANTEFAAPNPAGPPGSAQIFSDGSVAYFLPTRRALAWQSTAPDGTPVVQERYWITLQPGEIRACDGCHGVNERNQANAPAATNTALAFRDLLARWSASSASTRIFADGFE